LQFIDATLDAFTEQGDPVWALSYASANMHEISGVVGMRVSYDFDMGWGLLSPTLRAEYSRAFDTNLTQSLAYANTPNVDYAFGLAGIGQNTVSGNVGLQARYANGVTAALEYEFSSSGSFEQSQGLRGSLKVPF
jgi:large repetitive protein